MPVTDELLGANARYAETHRGPLPHPPARQVAVVACADAQLDVYRAGPVGGRGARRPQRRRRGHRRRDPVSEAFPEPEDDVRVFVFDVATGRLSESADLRPAPGPLRAVLVHDRSCRTGSARVDPRCAVAA